VQACASTLRRFAYFQSWVSARRCLRAFALNARGTHALLWLAYILL